MGARSIEMELDGSLSECDLTDKFRDRQTEDREHNGHANGYSGDFQTVEEIVTHDGVFNTYADAQDHCLKHAQKWRYAIAVRYKSDVQVKPTKGLNALNKRVKALRAKHDKVEARYNTWATKIWEKRKPVLNRKKTIKCGTCKSTLNLKYINSSDNGYACPLCNRGLLTTVQLKRSNTFRRELSCIKAKYDGLMKKRSLLKAALYTKAASKSDKTRWLIAGWGAC